MMEISNRMQIIIERGQNYGSITNRPYEKYLDLDIDSNIINNIKQEVDAKQSFQIEVITLSKIVVALKKKIENLLQHPDFDPIKEKERSKFKIQYESYPLEYNGNKYYLYPKSGKFPIDEEISSTVGFMKTLQAHIKSNEPLKYNYKEYDE